MEFNFLLFNREPVHFLASPHNINDVFEILLKKDANFNVGDDDDRTLLHYLSYVNHPEIVSYLVENNLCDFSFDANGESPLSLAVREKNYAVTSVYLTMFGPEVLENGEELIEIARANKDEKTLSLLEQNIRTARLLRVVTTGNLQMVKECIEKGENIDQINSQGFTALGIAISQDNYEIVKYLLENKANPTIGSAIKNAANRKNKAICDLLIQKMSNVNDFDENGFTFLDYIVASPQFMADLFINLIKRGAKLEQKNKHDDTSPYDVIIDERNYEAIDALVANHIPLDVPNRYSFTHAASALNNHSFLLYIINKGGKVNFEFNEQYPIQVALKSQFIQQDEDSALEDIKLLLNPTSFEDFFATALVLLENGADIKQSFISAIRDKDPIAIFFYLINGVTQKSIFSQSHFLVESLLKFFSTDSYDSLGRYFLSNNKLLILAARFSPPEKLSFLIKKGFDIDAPDFNGMRPIHHAIAACKFGNVRVLIENCAMVQPPHFLIPSMLHFIAANEKMAYVKCSPEQFNYSLVHFLVDYLVRNGEYVDISSKNGETPLAVAIDHKNYRLAEILLQKGAENDCSLAAKFLKNMVNEFPHETSNAFKDENLKIGSKTLAMPAKSNSFLISSNHPSALFKFITLFFGNNADFNTVIEPATKRTILHIACQNHLLSFIRFLVVNGADVNIPDANGVSPMTEAIINNRPDIIELLITPRLDLNIRDSKGRTAFSYASCKSPKTVLTLLVNHGAKINIPDYKGRTPLYFAAKYGNQESVAFLLGKKVLAAIGDARHRTPIHAAAKSGKDYIIKKFLSIGMHSLDSIRDINGDTPLHYAVKSKQIKVIELLISNNPSLMYEQNRKGESPLTLAASLEQRQIIDMMFQNGATFQPCESFFALKKGVAKDDINTIKELTKKNLDVKIRQRNLSIIDYSVESDSLSILQFFDKQSMMDKNDLLPIALAYLHGRRQIFDFLVDAYQIRNPEEALKPFLPKLAPPSDNERIEMIKKAKKISKEIYHPPSDVLKKVGIKFVGDNPNLNKLLWKAYSDHNPEQMKLLLQYGANPNSRNENGDTLLLAATNDSNINVIHLLCLFGVNPDKQSKNSKRCPLYNAIVNTKIDVIVALIMNGANLYSIDDNHNSAYHIAIQNKKNEIVKLFIQYGLDINCKNDEGKTPLHVAIELNNVDICNLLISSGALINTCDNNNITPRDLATRSGNGSIIQLLFKSKTETIDPRLVVHQ